MVFTFTVSTLKAAFDSTLESLQKISVLTWEMNFLSDWFSICFWQKKMSSKVEQQWIKEWNYEHCFNPNTNMHGKIFGRLTCLSSLGIITLSLIKIKKHSVSVSKLNTNIIKTAKTICFKSKIRNSCRRTMVNRCLVVLFEFNGKTPWHWQCKYSVSG